MESIPLDQEYLEVVGKEATIDIDNLFGDNENFVENKVLKA